MGNGRGRASISESAGNWILTIQYDYCSSHLAIDRDSLPMRNEMHCWDTHCQSSERLHFPYRPERKLGNHDGTHRGMVNRRISGNATINPDRAESIVQSALSAQEKFRFG